MVEVYVSNWADSNIGNFVAAIILVAIIAASVIATVALADAVAVAVSIAVVIAITCRRPFRIVPYTCTFVQYIRTFGTPN
jgi:hypothetical protein